MVLEVEWDDAKSERCRRERGFSFADVVPAFADPGRRVEVDDTRRGGVVRIISARKANARERRRHGEGAARG